MVFSQAQPAATSIAQRVQHQMSELLKEASEATSLAVQLEGTIAADMASSLKNHGAKQSCSMCAKMQSTEF
jgi:hypothetical protein